MPKKRAKAHGGSVKDLGGKAWKIRLACEGKIRYIYKAIQSEQTGEKTQCLLPSTML
jgi:hypothetical protein